MKKLYKQASIAFILFVFAFPAFAQKAEIKGIVRDTTAYPLVGNAVAALIGAKDSVLVAFTRSKRDGSFTLPNLPYGNYILIISHPDFGDYAEEITLSDSIKLISRDYYLVQKSILLNEMLIMAQRDVKVKGDTTEYTAGNYKMMENTTAEDLLKVLPGIRVDKDGKITAYGETVNKVYVDGEEFFGDDPTIATRNLKAEMIDKVQVYDKKSDQETVTGVDDGEKNTVMNIKLKEEFKKGFFGKVHLSAGLPDRLDNGLMFNSFKDKRKFTAYITQSNIGNNSLDWKDREKYGTGNNYVYEDGMYYSYYSSEDNILDGNEGISNSINGGTNYINKFFKNKLNLNSSYSFNSGNREIIRSTNTQQTINDSTYFKNQKENYKASLLGHKPNVRLVFDLDSNNSITYSINATLKKTNLNGSYYSETLTDKKDSLNKNIPLNNSLRNIDQVENSSAWIQSLLVSHKFKKKGRTLSLNANLDLKENSKLKIVNTKQQYYNEGLLIRTDTLNQKNDNNLYSRIASAKASYTEPLGKKWSLEVHYKPSFATSKSSISASVKDLSGEYNMFVDTLSNNFLYDLNKHEAGTSIKYFHKKLNITLTVNDEIGKQKRTDMINPVNNSAFNYNSVNPSLQISYTFKNSMNLNFRYNGINRQPQMSQLQPIKDYTNPPIILNSALFLLNL